jgi:hypothetical protein
LLRGYVPVALVGYWASTGWKKVATRLLARVAYPSRGFLKGLRVFALHNWHEASALARVAYPSRGFLKGLCVFALHNWREACALWVIALRSRRKKIEELWSTVARYLDKTPKTQLATIGAVALVSAIVSFLATSEFLQRPVSVPAAVALRADDTLPQQPKLSWITYYELQHEQKLGRLLLDISPADLLSMYERQGSATVDGYRDSWVKLNNPVMSFDQQFFNKASYDIVEATAHFNSVFPGKIIAIFDALKWHSLIAMHRAGDQIVAFCQFKKIEREQVLTNIDRLWFYGAGCEFPQR